MSQIQEKKAGFKGLSGFLLDSSLVVITLAVLATTAWYLDAQMKRFHIPTQLELAMADNATLAQQMQTLENKALIADEQLRLKARYSLLQSDLEKLRARVEQRREKNASLDEQVLAKQHDIRQADKVSRDLARNQLLPGLVVGTVRTKTGKVYEDCVIRAIERGLITIRHQDGQARFKLSLLVKETLPALARYAFGVDNIVDMSDFDAPLTGSTPVKKTVVKEEPREEPSAVEYDLPKGEPVLDGTNAPEEVATPISNEGQWQEPMEPLPL